MKVETEMEWETLEELIRKSLKEDIENVRSTDNDKDMIRHLRKVLKFYSTTAQWKEYKEIYED